MDSLAREDSEALYRAIAQWRNNVIDYDIVVDDARQALERAAGDLQTAETARTHAVRHLQHLLGRVDDARLSAREA
jgi:hypothetical protein